MSTGVGVLAVAGLRGRRRGGLAATLVVLTLSAVAISAGLVVSRQGARLLDDAADRPRSATSPATTRSLRGPVRSRRSTTSSSC
jgi:hypothetical protein